MKKEQKAGIRHPVLQGKSLGMIFTKASTRTRVSFEVGMYQLGGNALFLSAQDIQLRRGETVGDTARVLERYLDGIMIRTFAQADVEDLAKYGSIPVINGLTDLHAPHPGPGGHYDHRGASRASWPASSWPSSETGTMSPTPCCRFCAKVGMHMSIACPPGYEPDAEILAGAQADAAWVPDLLPRGRPPGTPARGEAGCGQRSLRGGRRC